MIACIAPESVHAMDTYRFSHSSSSFFKSLIYNIHSVYYHILLYKYLNYTLHLQHIYNYIILLYICTLVLQYSTINHIQLHYTILYIYTCTSIYIYKSYAITITYSICISLLQYNLNTIQNLILDIKHSKLCDKVQDDKK